MLTTIVLFHSIVRGHLNKLSRSLLYNNDVSSSDNMQSARCKARAIERVAYGIHYPES